MNPVYIVPSYFSKVHFISSTHLRLGLLVVVLPYLLGSNPGHIRDQLVTAEFQFFRLILIFLIQK
jgi:hypothetical protein